MLFYGKPWSLYHILTLWFLSLNQIQMFRCADLGGMDRQCVLFFAGFFFFLHWSKWHIQQNRTMCGQNTNPLVPHKIYSLPTFSKVHELFSCPHSTTCKTLCIYCTFSTHCYFQNCWKLMQKRMANVVHFWGKHFGIYRTV